MGDERRKAADTVEGRAPERHGGSQAVLPPHAPGEQRARQEGVGNLGGSEPGGEARFGGQPGIQRGDKAGSGNCEGRRDPVQVIRPHMEVAIRDHQHVVPGAGEHVDEVADLAVRAMLRRVHDHRDVAGWKPPL